MTTAYEGNTDTTGVTGNPGPVDLGTAHVASPRDTTSDGDGSARFGGGPYPEAAPATQPDTTSTNGTSVLTDPVSTDYVLTPDTLYGIVDAYPDYKAPDPYVPAGSVDTTGTNNAGLDFDQNKVGPLNWIYMTQETYTIGAGAPGEAGSQSVVLTDAGVALAQKNILRNTLVVRTDTGHTEEVTEEFEISESGKELYRRGVVAGSLVLETEGGDPLVEGDDYTVSVLGTEANAWFEVSLVSTSALVSEGDRVVATYEVGKDSYFRPVVLVENVDYTVSRSGSPGDTTTTVARVSSSEAVQDGDTVVVEYLYGDLSKFHSRAPQDVPAAPTGVVAFRMDRYVDVQWVPPATSEQIDGYLIESSTEGHLYVSADQTRALVRFLEPDRHNNTITQQDYRFRVAAVNQLGRGPYSEWTEVATSPLNYDEVPPSTIPLANRINPIYRADGTTVPGTGLGAV